MSTDPLTDMFSMGRELVLKNRSLEQANRSLEQENIELAARCGELERECAELRGRLAGGSTANDRAWDDALTQVSYDQSGYPFISRGGQGGG